MVEGMDIGRGVEWSLIATLDAARDAFERGQTHTALNVLNAFVHKVEAQKGNKLTHAQADRLLDRAFSVIEILSHAREAMAEP